MDFNKNNGPNVTKNPLPNHAGPNVNAIMEESGMKINTRVDEVKASMNEVYKVMVRMGVIPKKKFFEGTCCYYREACLNHTIGECEIFKVSLQRMIDQKKIEFSKR